MKSNFVFLKEYWPVVVILAVADAGVTAFVVFMKKKAE